MGEWGDGWWWDFSAWQVCFFGRVEEKGSHGWSRKAILWRGRLGREEATDRLFLEPLVLRSRPQGLREWWFSLSRLPCRLLTG